MTDADDRIDALEQVVEENRIVAADESEEIRVEAGKPTDVPHREVAEEVVARSLIVQMNDLIRHLKWFLVAGFAVFLVIYLVVRHA